MSVLPLRPIIVYMTFPTEEEAHRIGTELVSSHLVAGINIFPTVRSLYWWQGEIRRKEECVAIAQSTACHLPRLVETVVSMHSYTVPCITAFFLADGFPPFLEWIKTETIKNKDCPL